MSKTVQYGPCVHPMKNSESNEDSRTIGVKGIKLLLLSQITLTFSRRALFA